jgi:hypothetical protein
MGTYHFDHFPFEDPEIARALSLALTALLWSSVPKTPSPQTSPVKRVRQKRHSVQRRQTTTKEAQDRDE